MRTSLIDGRGIPGQNFHRRARQFRGPSVLVLACFTGLFGFTRADAVVLGPTPWAVLRCQLSDMPLPNVAGSFYDDFFTESGKGKGGLYDYWGQISMAQISLHGTQVLPWVPLNITSAQDPPPQRSRQKQVQDCIDATEAYIAANHLATDLANFYGLFMIQNSPGGEFGAQWTVAINKQPRTMGIAFFEFGALNLANAAHEMGHGYGLDHAEDTAHNHNCGGYPSPTNPQGYGDYCDYFDVMGNPASFGTTFSNSNFGTQGSSGPGLNAQHLGYLGWIPRQRVCVSDVTEFGNTTATLAALSQPTAPGCLAMEIWSWVYDGSPSYAVVGYTVEFRRSKGWDQKIADSILIHKGASTNGFAETFLIDDKGGPQFVPGQPFVDTSSGVEIIVNSIDPATDTANITIYKPAPPPTSGGSGGGGTPPPPPPKHYLD